MRTSLPYLPLLLCLALLPACRPAERVSLEPRAEAQDDKKEAPKGDATKARNWSSWRGPEQTGVSREKDLPEKFSVAKKLNLVFTAPYGSLATPIVQNDTVYLVGKVGEGETQQERAVAVDANTGKLKWEKKHNVWHTGIVDDRLGFTHAVGDPETGNVYFHLTSGMLLCYDKDGKELWNRSLTEEFGRVSGYGGRVTSPIIDEDKVILNFVNGSWGDQTVGATRAVAFDKKTGEIIWWASGGRQVKDTYYATPVVAVIAGQRLMIIGSGDGHVHAFQVRTGKKVWSTRIEDGGGAINCSPVVMGDKIWIGHGEENEGGSQGRVVCIDGADVKDGAAKIVWKYEGVKAKFAAPILHEGLLYVCDDLGKLYCFDAEKGGDPLWSFDYGTNTKGSPLWADGKIYVSEVDGKFHVLQADRKGCKRLHEERFRGQGLHGGVAAVNGRVYFTTTRQLVCIGKPDHKAAPATIPPTLSDGAAAKTAKAAQVQIVPADVTIEPGKSVTLKVATYDEKGRRIGSQAQAEWALEGVRPPVFPPGVKGGIGAPGKPPPLAGELSSEKGETTTFTAAEKPNGMFGTITALVDGVKADCRVRTVPVLPYAMDFSSLPVGPVTPGGWVNAPGKFSVLETLVGQDKMKVLFKRNNHPSPLVNRAYAYLGSPHLSDYTIEAEVRGEQVRKDMPDVGVGACRYTLTLAGNDKELRLGSWDAQKRVEKTAPFAWKSGEWYHMKLTATVANDKGVVKGKVWPRGGKEPADWTVELEDPAPNRSGSPAIYGDAVGTLSTAKGQEGSIIHFANVKVTANANKK